MKYLNKIINPINHIIVTLRFSILSIFITLFVSASIILMIISYKNSSDDIIFTANQSMRDITQSLNQLFKAEMSLAERDANITASLIDRKVIDVNNPKGVMDYLYALAEQFDIVQAIYWGDVEGNYISAEYNADDSISSYFDNVNTSPPSELVIHRDIKGNVTSTTVSDAHYDPRHRPWFLTANTKGKATWTNVYLYEPGKYLGITLAVPVYDADKKLKGVLGVDVRLDWISWYINSLKVTPHGVLFVVQEDGKIIGYPNFDKLPKQTQLNDIHSLPSKWIADSFDLYKKNNSNSFSFKYGWQTYLAAYQPILTLTDHKWLIGLVIPEGDFIGQLNKARMLNILISLLILLVGILLIMLLVNSIVRPVKSLIMETDKIKNFDLDGGEKVKSRVKEILLLSDAIDTMRNGLKAFKRYVPSELVKQLIRKGENAKLGGTHKLIAAFFSDIRDFTTIAHHANPDMLMSQLNEYFEVLTNIILKENGTIDKYIGDAIMAFWGAPDDISDPCHHAADAALQFIEQLNSLNKKWESEGKPAMHTRIGIHYGEAIVGNLGSSERINYTAIGDSINIASRIEGINKELNTNILVSDAVYTIIKNDFDCREAGDVSLKGIAEKVRVYELTRRKTEK